MAILDIDPQQDTWIDEESPSTTHGSSETLITALSYGTQRESMIEFDIPSSNLGTITAIDLMLYDLGTYPSGLVCNLYRTANSTWSSSTATWNSDNGNYTGSILDTNTSTGVASWTTWGIYGPNAINPHEYTWGDNVSLMVRESGSSSGWKGFGFASSKYTTDTDLRPYLRITYTSTFTPKVMMF